MDAVIEAAGDASREATPSVHSVAALVCADGYPRTDAINITSNCWVLSTSPSNPSGAVCVSGIGRGVANFGDSVSYEPTNLKLLIGESQDSLANFEVAAMEQVKNIRSWLWNGGAAIFYITLTIYVVASLSGFVRNNNENGGIAVAKKLTSGPCEMTEVQEIESPDGKKTAKLGFSDCGATTNWRSGIRILNRSTGKVHTGLFGLDGKPGDLKMRWSNDFTLVLSGFQIEKILWFNQDEFSGVKIVLQP